MTDAGTKLVYIASMGHSGSTLLDLLIGAHSEVLSVGEVKGFATGQEECSCEAPTVWECRFWRSVGEAFRAATGVSLERIRLHSEDDDEFLAHNRALVDALRKVSGKRFIVDSSKSLARLTRLLETRAVDVLPIHLLRSPQGVAYSSLKKDRNWVVTAIRYGRRLNQTKRILGGVPHLEVRYEDLTANPQRELRHVMDWLGLSFEPTQLDWATRERHNFGGNSMRFTRDSAIRPDVAWRSGLTRWQKTAVGSLALAGRVSSFFMPLSDRLGREAGVS